MDARTLERLFSKALRTCKFFPKVSEILQSLDAEKQSATEEAAEQAWEMVLDVRRVYWNPDIPHRFDAALHRLSERVRQAARASGVFGEHESVESLHVWCKQRFLKSFLGYDETGAFLLLNPELQRLIYGVAQRKALTEPKRAALPVPKQEAPEERLRIADQLAEAARQVIAQADAKRNTITVSDGDREAFRKQAERIKALYPDSKTTDPVLLQFVSQKTVST